MKKLSISLFALLFCLSLLTTSCSKTCHGGGWYGNRNLSSLEIEKPVKKDIKVETTIANEVKEEETNETATTR